MPWLYLNISTRRKQNPTICWEHIYRDNDIFFRAEWWGKLTADQKNELYFYVYGIEMAEQCK